MSQVTQVQLRKFPYLFVLHNGELGCLNLNQYFELDFVSLKFWTRLRVVQGFRLSVEPLGFDLASTSSSSTRTSIISHIYLNLLMFILTTWTNQRILVSYPSLLLFPLTSWLASSRLYVVQGLTGTMS